MRIKRNKHILLFFDTNIFYDVNEECTKFSFGRNFEMIKDFINLNNYNQFKIIIPRIVVEELTKQKIEYFNEKNKYVSKERTTEDKIKKFYQYIEDLGYEVNLQQNNYKNIKEYKTYIKKVRDKYLSLERNNFTIVEYSEGINFNSIVRSSINKKLPFFKAFNNKKEISDAGFKDVIFIESVKKYLKTHNSEYVIITNDEIMSKINLEKEIKNRQGTILCSTDIDNIISYLEEKYDKKDFSKFIKYINSDYFQQQILDLIGFEIFAKDMNVIEKLDEYDNKIYGFKLNVNNENEKLCIIVYLDEDKNIVLIENDENKSVIYLP